MDEPADEAQYDRKVNNELAAKLYSVENDLLRREQLQGKVKVQITRGHDQ